MLKRISIVAAQVMVAGFVLLLAGCVVDDTYRDGGRYYRSGYRHYDQRVDYRYGSDRDYGHSRDRYRDYRRYDRYDRCD